MTSDEPQNEAPLPPRSPFDRGKSHIGKVLAATHLDERQVCLRISADYLAGFAAVGGNLEARSVGHDVIIGNDIAVSRDEESRPQREA